MTPAKQKKILILGDRGGTRIGGSLERAALNLGLEVRFIEASRAMKAPVWIRRFNWWLRGRQPTHLKALSREVAQTCRDWQPDFLLTTGIAPLDHEALGAIGSIGVFRINYLTDDPWNSHHFAPWFLKALPCYDRVFTTRRSNLAELNKAGCRGVSFLPFGYDPSIHYPEVWNNGEKIRYQSDIAFVGCADADRVPYIHALIKQGFNVGLYGDYWDRFQETKNRVLNYADPEMMRKAISGARAALCLVRRANRDGNSMRSFEIPAVGTCMLTEETEEHKEIFGQEGESVVYFRTISEMLAKLKWLLKHEKERKELALKAHKKITQGGHTYQDRLITMLTPHLFPPPAEREEERRGVLDMP